MNGLHRKVFAILFLTATAACGQQGSSDGSIGEYDEAIIVTVKDNTKQGDFGRIYFTFDYSGRYDMTLHQLNIEDEVALGLRGHLSQNLSVLTSNLATQNDPSKRFCVQINISKEYFDIVDEQHEICFDSVDENEKVSELFSVLSESFVEGDTDSEEGRYIRLNYPWTLPGNWVRP